MSQTGSAEVRNAAGAVRVALEESCVVVELCGEIDADLGDDLLEAAADVEQAGLPVEVRAAPVTFMDSTGVAFLARAASCSPQRLRLVDPPELVRFLVRVTAIDSLLDVVDVAGGAPAGADPPAAPDPPREG